MCVCVCVSYISLSDIGSSNTFRGGRCHVKHVNIFKFELRARLTKLWQRWSRELTVLFCFFFFFGWTEANILQIRQEEEAEEEEAVVTFTGPQKSCNSFMRFFKSVGREREGKWVEKGELLLKMCAIWAIARGV